MVFNNSDMSAMLFHLQRVERPEHLGESHNQVADGGVRRQMLL
jgi:hypothetical protein